MELTTRHLKEGKRWHESDGLSNASQLQIVCAISSPVSIGLGTVACCGLFGAYSYRYQTCRMTGSPVYWYSYSHKLPTAPRLFPRRSTTTSNSKHISACMLKRCKHEAVEPATRRFSVAAFSLLQVRTSTLKISRLQTVLRFPGGSPG